MLNTEVFCLSIFSLLKFVALLFLKLCLKKQCETIYFKICLENTGHLIAIILNPSFILFSHFILNCFFSKKICFLLEQISAFTSFYWRAVFHKSYFESMKNNKYQKRGN